MPNFDIEIDFEVYCATCGAGLCGQSEGTQNNRGLIVNVEACENCIDIAKEESYQEGYEEAEQEYENKINEEKDYD